MSEKQTALAAFERVYRNHLADVTGFFARRSTEPQVVADLTADTFVRAMTSFTTFDPRRGSVRAWLIGIARRVFAAHCEQASRHDDAARRAGGQRQLPPDEVGELVTRIDAERAGRGILARLATMPETDREAIELVDLAGLTPQEAAGVLGIGRGALRMRLSRARNRLRAESPHINLEVVRENI